MHTYLEFERPIAELEGKIVELRKLAEEDPAMQIETEVGRLQSRADGMIRDIYAKLTPGRRSRLRAIRAGRISLIMRAICSTSSRRWPATALSATTTPSSPRSRAFAAARLPSSATRRATTPSRASSTISAWRCRKVIARRSVCSRWPNRFGLPVISLVDTSGAYTGVAAEERGQSEAIARSTQAGLESARAVRRDHHRRRRFGRRARDRDGQSRLSCSSIRSIR